MTGVLFLLCGAIFGFLLHQARATDYDIIVSMFRFQNLHLAGVMAVAIAVAAIGLWVLRRVRPRPLVGAEMDLHRKPMQRGVFSAGLVFGSGWALTGA